MWPVQRKLWPEFDAVCLGNLLVEEGIDQLLCDMIQPAT